MILSDNYSLNFEKKKTIVVDSQREFYSEMKQINFDSKSMRNENSMKRLIQFVHHLEEKLLSVKIVHDRLDQLITIVSKTHENILQDLSNIKAFLNQTAIQQDEDDDE